MYVVLMAISIEIFDTTDDLARHVISLLTSAIVEIPADQTFSLVLSGGRTPKLIYRHIASICKNTIDWTRMKIFWGDERCVDPRNPESNYKMAREILLDHIPIPSSNIFRIRGEADPVEESIRYSDLFPLNVKVQQGILQPDFIMLGLGEDGHTASIFPENIELFSSEKLFETAEHPVTGQKRITATGKIINHAKRVVIVATGEAKADVVEKIIKQLDGFDRLPAARVQPEKGAAIWLLDRAAARKLHF